MSSIGVTSGLPVAEALPSQHRAASARFTIYGVILGVASLALFGGGAARYAIPVHNNCSAPALPVIAAAVCQLCLVAILFILLHKKSY